eukprot:1159304-Rhodomonas_salina.1
MDRERVSVCVCVCLSVCERECVSEVARQRDPQRETQRRTHTGLRPNQIRPSSKAGKVNRISQEADSMRNKGENSKGCTASWVGNLKWLRWMGGCTMR